MNKVVTRHHVPASHLPDHLRGSIPASAFVAVTITEEEGVRSMADFFRELDAYRSAPDFRPVTLEDAVARLRCARDGRDDGW